MDRSGDIGPSAPEHEGQESEPPPRLRLEAIVEDGDWAPVETLEALLGDVSRVMAGAPELRQVFGERATACVAFSSDAAVRALNAQYRAKDKPTNVLSFPAAPLPPGTIDPDEPRHLGDIVLAAETVAGEARDLDIPLDHHVKHLIVHGVLHLVGHDHEDDAEADAMEALETRLLAGLGVADPYRGID